MVYITHVFKYIDDMVISFMRICMLVSATGTRCKREMMLYYLYFLNLNKDFLLCFFLTLAIYTLWFYDDVIKWKHFPRYRPFVRESAGDRWNGPFVRESTGHRWNPLTKQVARSFDVFRDLCLNKQLNKPSKRRWFETPSRSWWRHYNIICGLPTVVLTVKLCFIMQYPDILYEWRMHCCVRDIYHDDCVSNEM